MSYTKSRPVEYKAWKNMKARCYSPSASNYKNYGGMGVGVCQEWLNSFQTFYNDMGPRPSDRHFLKLIDKCLDFGPKNCQWSQLSWSNTSKVCSKCKTEYTGELTSFFGPSTTSPSGFHSCCRLCLIGQRSSKRHREIRSSYDSSVDGRHMKIWSSAKSRSISRGLDFDLSKQQVKSLFSNQSMRCSVTGLPFYMGRRGEYRGIHPYSPSLDRIDSRIGYTEKNTRLVLSCVNFSFGQWGEEFFCSWIGSYLGIGPHVIHNFCGVYSTYITEKSLSDRVKKILKSIKDRTKNKITNTDIDHNYIISKFEEQNGKCSLTGIPFDISRLEGSIRNPYLMSLDRIDSSSGYVKGNVRLVLLCVNLSLNEWGDGVLSSWSKEYLNRKLLNRVV